MGRGLGTCSAAVLLPIRGDRVALAPLTNHLLAPLLPRGPSAPSAPSAIIAVCIPSVKPPGPRNPTPQREGLAEFSLDRWPTLGIPPGNRHSRGWELCIPDDTPSEPRKHNGLYVSYAPARSLRGDDEEAVLTETRDRISLARTWSGFFSRTELPR